ncbi:MAG: hypothetical protein NWE86_04770 [Candidatus Bathyarchaeota archaeon]|nr:hypothetical protein [Candidatus Bathyarchaeota archaeon]
MLKTHITKIRAMLVIVLILVAGLGGYIYWVYMQPKAFSHVSGFVHLDEPIVGAAVSVYDLDGVKVFEKEDVTHTTGSFVIKIGWGIGKWGSYIPDNFTIVASGGTIDNEPFNGTIVRAVHNYSEIRYYHLNAITTLIKEYLDKHPEMTYVEAQEAVKDFLGVPDLIDMDLVVDSAVYYHGIFDHEYFMFKAEEHGDFDTFIDALLEGIDRGDQQVFVAAGGIGGPTDSRAILGDYKDLAVALGKGVADKFGGPIGGAVAGWVLSDIFGVKSAEQKDLDEIKQRLEEQNRQLKEIRAQIDALKDQVRLLEEELKASLRELGFTFMSKEADTAVDNIKIRHDLLIGYSDPEYIESLKQNEAQYNDIMHQINNLVDQITSTDAGTWHDLNTIHENLISTGGTWGMLDLWKKATINNINKTHQPTELAGLTDQVYEESWAFYNRYLMAQLQGYTLLMEAYHARNDIQGAKTVIKHMNETITEQVLQFRPLLEQEILYLNKDCKSDKYCPINNILHYREFPFMEVSKWYQYKGWSYTSKFETLDQDINLILGSMKNPPRYEFFTARVLLNPLSVDESVARKCKNYPFPHDFENGLPLTFRNVDTGTEYTVKGTENKMNLRILRYDFQVPAGFYVLVKPLDVVELPMPPDGHNGWAAGMPGWNETSKKYDAISEQWKMSLGIYEDRPWIEVRSDTATYWGGVWYEWFLE